MTTEALSSSVCQSNYAWVQRGQRMSERVSIYWQSAACAAAARCDPQSANRFGGAPLVPAPSVPPRSEMERAQKAREKSRALTNRSRKVGHAPQGDFHSHSAATAHTHTHTRGGVQKENGAKPQQVPPLPLSSSVAALALWAADLIVARESPWLQAKQRLECGFCLAKGCFVSAAAIAACTRGCWRKSSPGARFSHSPPLTARSSYNSWE